MAKVKKWSGIYAYCPLIAGGNYICLKRMNVVHIRKTVIPAAGRAAK